MASLAWMFASERNANAFKPPLPLRYHVARASHAHFFCFFCLVTQSQKLCCRDPLFEDYLYFCVKARSEEGETPSTLAFGTAKHWRFYRTAKLGEVRANSIRSC